MSNTEFDNQVPDLSLVPLESGSEKPDESAEALYAGIAALETRVSDLQAQNEAYATELANMSEIQKSFLPESLQTPNVDIVGATDQAYGIGGDFFHFSLLPTGAHGQEQIGIAVVDVVDKNGSAAMITGPILGMLLAFGTNTKLIADENGHPTPEKMVLNINLQLLQLFHKTDFATMIYGVLNGETGEFTYVRAGHEHLILLDPNGNLKDVPKPKGFPVGLIPNLELEVGSIIVPQGGKLIIHTDGVSDETNDRVEHFGVDNLVSVLGEATGHNAQSTVDHVLMKLKKHRGVTPQSDDISLVVVRRK